MYKFLLFFVFSIGFLFLLVRSFENKFLFYPTKYEILPNLSNLDFPSISYKFSVDGNEIHGLYFPNEAALKTVLFFHGNAGNALDRIHFIQSLMGELPVNVFIIDYRGYGLSEGNPSETGIYRDAQAAYDFLMQEKGLAPEDIIIWGKSLGGAVAVDLASKNHASCLIAESTFTRAKDMTAELFGPIPLWIFSSIRLSSVDKISSIKMPKLVIHGKADEVVPFKLGKSLYEAAAGEKRFVEFSDAHHNDVYLIQWEKYFESLRQFFGDFNIMELNV